MGLKIFKPSISAVLCTYLVLLAHSIQIPGILHIVTCIAPKDDRELRYNERVLTPYLSWNASASGFRAPEPAARNSWAVRVRNVCKKGGKDVSRLEALATYLNAADVHINDILVFTESTTLFNSVATGRNTSMGSVQEVIERFDSVRAGRDVLLAAQPWCKVQGEICTREIENYLYPARSNASVQHTMPCPKYVNGANFMGIVRGLRKMIHLMRELKSISSSVAHDVTTFPQPMYPGNVIAKWRQFMAMSKPQKFGEQSFMQFLHVFQFVSSVLDTDARVFAASCTPMYGLGKYKGVQLMCNSQPCKPQKGKVDEFIVIPRYEDRREGKPIFQRISDSKYSVECGVNHQPLIIHDLEYACYSWHERAYSALERSANHFKLSNKNILYENSGLKRGDSFTSFRNDSKTRLHILTCVTDEKGTKAWKADHLFHIWNNSASAFKILPGKEGRLIVRNVCDGIPWLGMATKSREYEKYLRGILETPGYSSSDLIMITDGLDVLFNSRGRSVDEVIEKYRLAVAEKEILLSSEMWCWIGMPCAPDHEEFLYGSKSWEAKRTACPRYLNAGAYIGTVAGLHRLVSLTWSLMYSLKGSITSPKSKAGQLAAGMGATQPPPEVAARYSSSELESGWKEFRDLPGWKSTKVFSRVPTEQGTIQFLHSRGHISTKIDLSGLLFSTGCVAQLNSKKIFHGFKCGQINCPLQERDEYVQVDGPIGSLARHPGSFYTKECGYSEHPLVLHFSGPCAPFWRRIGREIKSERLHQYFGAPQWPTQSDSMGREIWI